MNVLSPCFAQGNAVSVIDTDAFLTSDEAMIVAGGKWDEAQWEAAEKDGEGRIKAELLVAAVEEAKRKEAEARVSPSPPTTPPHIPTVTADGGEEMEPPPALSQSSLHQQRCLDDELRVCCVSITKMSVQLDLSDKPLQHGFFQQGKEGQVARQRSCRDFAA